MICKKCGAQFDGPGPECCNACTMEASARIQQAHVQTCLDNIGVRDAQLLNLDDADFLVANGVLLRYKRDHLGVTLPNGVTAIGDRVFKNKQTTNLKIPNSVKHIGTLAFQGTPWYDHLGQTYHIVGDQILLRYNGKNKFPCIPYGVKSIAYHTFLGMDLMDITIPDSVTEIGDGAFANNQLQSVTIPNAVTSIGSAAFAQNQLTTLDIPDSVTEIGDSAFSSNQLQTVTIPASVTTIGADAFSDNPLQSITVLNQESSIPYAPWGATTDGTEDGAATPIIWIAPDTI